MKMFSETVGKIMKQCQVGDSVFQRNIQSEDLLVSIGLLFSLCTVNLLRSQCVVRKGKR